MESTTPEGSWDRDFGILKQIEELGTTVMHRIDGVVARLYELESRFESFRSFVKDSEDAIETMEGISGQISNIDQDLRRKISEIAARPATKPEILDRLSKLESAVGALLRADLATEEAVQHGLPGSGQDRMEDVAALHRRMSAIEEKLLARQVALDEFPIMSVKSLTERVDALQERVSQLGEATTSNLDSILNRHFALQDDVGGLRVGQASHKDGLDKLGASLVAIEKGLDDLTKFNMILRRKAQDMGEDLVKLQGRLSEVEKAQDDLVSLDGPQAPPRALDQGQDPIPFPVGSYVRIKNSARIGRVVERNRQFALRTVILTDLTKAVHGTDDLEPMHGPALVPFHISLGRLEFLHGRTQESP